MNFNPNQMEGGWRRLCRARSFILSESYFRGAATNFPDFVFSVPQNLRFRLLIQDRLLPAVVLDEDGDLLYNCWLEVRYILNHGGVSYDPEKLDLLAEEDKHYLLDFVHEAVSAGFKVRPYDPYQMRHQYRIELHLYYCWAIDGTIQLRFFQEPVPEVNPNGPVGPWHDLGVRSIPLPDYRRKKIPVSVPEDFEANFENQRLLEVFRNYDCVRTSYLYTPAASFRGIEVMKTHENAFVILFEPISHCWRAFPQALQVWYRWRGYTLELAVQEPGEINMNMITLINLREAMDVDEADDDDDDDDDDEE